MANTNSTDTKKTSTKKLEEQLAKQEEQLKAQQEQIAQLLKLIQDNTDFSKNITTSINDSNVINADDEILVINLMPNKLNLLGDRGVVMFSFDHMYEEQYIDYSTLKEIVRLNRQMAKNGRFYIADERAVNKLRLKNDYKNILSPEQLKRIIGQDVNKAIELYKLAPTGQKSVIIDLVKEAKFNKGGVDYNLLKELSEISGVDLVNVEDATQIATE